MSDSELLLFLERLCPEAAAELRAAQEHHEILLDTIENLRGRVEALPSSDEVQVILRGILIVLKLMITTERSAWSEELRKAQEHKQ